MGIQSALKYLGTLAMNSSCLLLLPLPVASDADEVGSSCIEVGEAASKARGKAEEEEAVTVAGLPSSSSGEVEAEEFWCC